MAEGRGNAPCKVSSTTLTGLPGFDQVTSRETHGCPAALTPLGPFTRETLGSGTVPSRVPLTYQDQAETDSAAAESTVLIVVLPYWPVAMYCPAGRLSFAWVVVLVAYGYGPKVSAVYGLTV